MAWETESPGREVVPRQDAGARPRRDAGAMPASPPGTITDGEHVGLAPVGADHRPDRLAGLTEQGSHHGRSRGGGPPPTGATSDGPGGWREVGSPRRHDKVGTPAQEVAVTNVPQTDYTTLSEPPGSGTRLTHRRDRWTEVECNCHFYHRNRHGRPPVPCRIRLQVLFGHPDDDPDG